ncbi:hypothetical protein [Pectinatus frisingensis]|uniref:hypothetical protein n=1 Tax=Pectinatus frisingensis TaxID=865 RepID=UPI0018C70261|nr:hypothetical protein [Pectinatus frisingensis]
MMILKTVFREKNIVGFVEKIIWYGSVLLVGAILSNSAQAEVRLPEMNPPDIQIPQPPAVPAPQLPEIKGIDTDKISAEINDHARSAKDNDKKSADNAASADKNNSSDDKTGSDKIKNNKYIKHDDTDKQTDNDATAAAEETGKDQASDQANKNIDAKTLLSTDFIGTMFYFFEKTAFIAVVMWLLLLFIFRNLPIWGELFLFTALNIIAGAIYFPLVEGLDNGQLNFYGKIITDKDFFIIIGTFAACSLLITAVIGLLIVMWEKFLKRDD